MSVLVPDAHPVLRPYEPTRVQKHYDQQLQNFTICPLGRFPDPINCSFVDRDGIHGAIYCEENSGVTIQYGIHIDYSAIIFEIVGGLEAANCFLTPEGDCNHPCGSEIDRDDPFASFWLKAPSDAPQDVMVWKRGLKQLERIVHRSAAVHAALGELVAPDYSGDNDPTLALLQMGWRPPNPYTLEYLPVFTPDNVHYPIPTLAMAPFNKRLSVRFTLHMAHATAGIPAILGARMLNMRILD